MVLIFGASAVGLLEPWACVERAYATEERSSLRTGGRTLVVADAGHAIEGLAERLRRLENHTDQLNASLETELTNLFAVGDGAGVSRGLIQASASGVVAAREILRRLGS